MKPNLAYSILERFCEVRNERNSIMGSENPHTNRVNFILDTIFDLSLLNGFKLNADNFLDCGGKNYKGKGEYVNIELSKNVGAESSVIFIAHHDVNNVNSDNCQDNTASVSNLLALAEHFNEVTPNKNLHIVFTDCEEFGGKGAKRLADRILEGVFGKVDYVVNLELTANGTNLWSDKENFDNASELADKILSITDVYEVKTPFNDSVVLRGRGIDSVCIGTLTDEDMEEVMLKDYCKTWALCHKSNDTFDNANANDMDNFVEFLTKLV